MKQTQAEKSNKYTIELIEDGEDLILPLPEELLIETGWKTGDNLDWKMINESTFTLSKVDNSPTPEEEEAWKELERKNNI